MKTISAILAYHLKKWGVTHVFGVPGKAILPIIDEIDNIGIKFILSSHEGAAGYEASGYAHTSQKIGVCCGTSGPGGTNLVTAAAQAKASNLPILILTGHPSQSDTGSGLGQDASKFGTDIVSLLEPVTKFSMHVDSPALFERYLLHAMESALTGVKGPVHLSISYDVLNSKIVPFDLELPNLPKTISSNLETILSMIKNASKPLIFAGKGVHSAKAYEELRIFAESFSIPVMTTTSAKSVFPTAHPMSLGGFGLGGTEEADKYMKATDLLIVLGTRMSDMSLSGYDKSKERPRNIIQFDYDPTFIGKSILSPTHAVLGDIKANLQELLLKEIKYTNYKQRALDSFGIMPDLYDDQKGDQLLTGEAIQSIQKELPQNAIIFGDCGSHTFYAIRDLVIEEPGSFIFDSYFGAMGHAIGYAVGAKLATPDRPVICLTGDGCMLMNGTEISTAVNAEANVIFVVINNGRLDMVEKGMTKYLNKSVGTIYNVPINASLFGESLGAKGFKCFNRKEVEVAMNQALKLNSPSVIEIIVDPLEVPPTMKR